MRSSQGKQRKRRRKKGRNKMSGNTDVLKFRCRDYLKPGGKKDRKS
jgi:hypothetical protein